jgi:hypothetical protein
MAKKLPVIPIVIGVTVVGLIIWHLHKTGAINFRHTTASDQGGVRPYSRHYPLSAGNFG